MATLVTNISAADWSPKLGEPGQVVENLDDINQCIKVILETPKGSRAHEPLFGCDIYRYLDWPQNEATPRIIAAVLEAVELWEPRGRLTSVQPVYSAGQVTVKLEWTLIDNGNVKQQTEVVL